MLLREVVGSIGVGCEFEAGEVVVYEIARVHGFGLTLCTGLGVVGAGGGDMTSLTLDSHGDASEDNDTALFVGENMQPSLRGRPPHGVLTLFCVETCHCN